MAPDIGRRDLLKSVLAAAAGLGLGTQAGLGGLSALYAKEDHKEAMPTRRLGRTGHKVSIFSLGGEATVEREDRQEEALEIINRALDLGVNYIDTAATYGRGGSEKNIGLVMQERRDEVFLATKTHDRSYDGTMRLFEQSLRRLKTDHVDLYQLHNIRTEDDVDRVMADDGALRAMRELKEQGAVGHIGITSHKDPDVLLEACERYDFDCVLMTLNVADVHYEPFQEKLLPAAVEDDRGVIAMKVTARGRVFRPDGVESMEQALGYVLSFPVSTAIVGISTLEELEQNVRIAREFEPFSDERLAEIEGLIAPYEEEGNFFKYHW